jgi:hypothetical protein
MTLRKRLASLERAAGATADGPPAASLFDKARRLAGWLTRYLAGAAPWGGLPADVRAWVSRMRADGTLDELTAPAAAERRGEEAGRGGEAGPA